MADSIVLVLREVYSKSMTTERFNGVPIKLERCSTEELEQLRDYSVGRIEVALGEVALLDGLLAPDNGQEPLFVLGES